MSELTPQQIAPSAWRAYTADTGEAEARAAFRARYGCEPAAVGISFGNVLAGPVPAEEEER